MDLSTLNAAQQQAVTHGNGPLLIVAGAGTGKTTVITQRIAWLILEQGLKLENVLALTFTDKAAQEMADRVSALLPYGYVDLWVSTFHAFCERLLKEHGLEIGLNTDFRLFNSTEQWRLVRRNFDRFSLDVYRPLGNPTKHIHALLKHFSRAKDEAITPDDYLTYAESLKLDRDSDAFIKRRDAADEVSDALRFTEIAQAYHVYQQLLHEENALDFGDLLTFTLRLFRERPAILERYRQQFSFVLVDEFQDTNWAQYELIKLLAQPKKNLTVVGDDDQSIYKFRGASISNILEFKKDFSDSAEVVLTENYRSKQAILDYSYRFIQLNNPNRLEYQLGNGQVGEKGHKLATPVSKQLTASREGVGRIELLAAETQDDEADLVADRIAALKQEQPDLTWGDFAVLVRANDHAEPIIEAFRRQGVPHQFYASKGLYRKDDVLDSLAYLRLLDNYHESASLYRVAQLPVFGIPTADLIEIGHEAKHHSSSLYDIFRRVSTFPNVSAAGRQGVDTILKLVTKHSEQARVKSALEIIMAFLTDSGLLKKFENPQNADEYEHTKTLLQFLKVVQDFQRGNPTPTVKAFVEDLTAQIEAGDEGSLAFDLEDSPDAVRIMTIHGAKGLEFSYVFVTQLVDKRFPTIERQEPIPLPDALVKEILPQGDIHVQEERRLFYVAATRARDGLFLTWAKDYGGVLKKKPSVFLYESGLLQLPLKETKTKRERSLPKAAIERSPQPLEPELRRVVDADNRFNFYKLHAYEFCPWRYRYQYVLKVPPKPSHQMSFGTSIHAALFELFKLLKYRAEHEQGSLFGAAAPEKKTLTDQDLVSEKELLDLYRKHWVGEWYETPQQMEEFRKKGEEALRRFYKDQQGHWPIPLKLEQEFAVKEGEYTLAGKIDRIDVLSAAGDKPTVEIIDYKTGQAAKKLFKQSERYQLFLYTLALEDPALFDLKVEKLTFSFVMDGTTESYEPKAPDLTSVKEWATRIIAKIKSGDFTATPSPQYCRRCDFRDICPYRAV